ncbi:hypothetical protein ACFQ0B_50175 [Nonomuraea thailandensis]
MTLAYVTACGGDPAEWEARWRAAAREPVAPEPPGDPADGETPPYPGLVAFQPEQAELFFGRSASSATCWTGWHAGRWSPSSAPPAAASPPCCGREWWGGSPGTRGCRRDGGWS